MLKALEDRVLACAAAAGAAGFYLWNFFYWKTLKYRYFIQVLDVYVAEQRAQGWVNVSMTLQRPVCYYLGQWELFWNKDNRRPVAPSGIMTQNIVSMSQDVGMPAEYITDMDQAIFDAAYLKYGESAMKTWAEIDRATPAVKAAFMADIENPDHTWTPSIWRQIETDMAEITLRYPRAKVETMFSQKWYIDQYRNQYHQCVRKEFPEQYKTTFTKPEISEKDLDKPLTALELPEPTRNPTPSGTMNQTVFTLNLNVGLIPNKGLTSTVSIDKK
jgi:hypothetical protein